MRDSVDYSITLLVLWCVYIFHKVVLQHISGVFFILMHYYTVFANFPENVPVKELISYC